ncbi:phosphoribosyltransferase [Agromyces arachidis]|uniref:phosphoribosyltransferase n=1 Tax=Agromyces arachidis TaxID=766966 RepID=UPI004055BD46
MTRFPDRRAAGRELASVVGGLGLRDPVVMGVPRGGVPVADVVARALDAPLDVLGTRVLRLPRSPGVAMGAVGEEGATIRYDDVVGMARISDEDFAEIERRARAGLDAEVGRLRAGRPPLPLAGRTVLVVDDGVATGCTARVACRIARARGAGRVVLAVPVGSPRALAAIPEADEVVAVRAPADFMSVGMQYVDFRQTRDEDVSAILAAAASRPPDARGTDGA